MPVVNTTQNFATGDTVTSTSLNNIMDQSIFIDGAVVTGDGLTVTAGGQMTIENLKVTGAKIGNLEVGTEKIANASIIPTKLSAGGPSWTASTTFLGNAVTGTYTTNIAPARTGDGSTELQFGSQATVSNSASITRNTGVNGTFAITNTGTGAIALSASGGVTFASANMPNPVGNAPIFGVRAWVNFNGTSGSTAIRQQGNVSSVSRTGTGLYTVNLTTPLNDTDYAIVGFARDAGTTPGNYFVSAVSNGTKTTSSFQIRVHSTGGLVDSPEINLMVIR